MNIVFNPFTGKFDFIETSQYNDELAQDTIGGILVDSATVDLTYDDVTPSITATVKDNSITEAKILLADNTTNDFSVTKHGFVPKGTNVGNFLKDDGTWGSPSGSGDMLLAGTQTVTGPKTFNDGKLLLRNVANTFNGVFTNANTADRTYTLQDVTGTLALLADIPDISGKQDTLVSGTNIKTINNNTILGSGNLSISGAVIGDVVGGSPVAGSVLYIGAAGVLAQDNDYFFYNPTQKQLGIGADTFLADGNKVNTVGSVNGVIQTNTQNQSNGTSASSDLVATADTGTDTENFVDVGINSSTYNDAAYSIGGALSGYLLTNGGDLTIGTATANKVVKVHTGGTTSDKLRFTVSDVRTTFLTDIETPNVIKGYSTTVTAAGTTTLTNTSNHHQFFTGTNTQTCILPNATTLSLGHPFLINNNSTGNVTIQTNGGATLFVAAGNTDVEVICTGNGTAAGTWNIFYYATEGLNMSEQFLITNSTNVLTSQTAAQPLFDNVGSGLITVSGSTTYFFECFFSLSSMSASSGSFGFALGGTATLTTLNWVSQAIKAATLTTAGTTQTTFNTTTANTTLVTASSSTANGHAKITGVLRVNAAGTIIPQVSLSVAAAAVVGINSYFRIWKCGSNTITSIGQWS